MVNEQFYELTKHLWRNGSYAYWWTPDTDEGKLSIWFAANKPTPVNPLWKSINVYFPVHPSRTQNGMRQRAKVVDVEVVNCLFAEFDLASGQTKDHLLAAINQMDKPPSVVIFSGGGFHCYWLLEQSYFTDSADARQRIIDIQYAWVDYTGSDDAAKDLARVLRVAGSFNRKPEYAPNYPQVEIVKFDLDLQYGLDELSIEVEHLILEAKAKRDSIQLGTVAPVDLDDTTLIEKMLQHDTVAVALWDGDLSGHEDDHSKADLALCSKLSFWLGRDRDRIDRVFRRSGLYRPKWLRGDYREKTIDKAIATTTSTYQPNGNGAVPQGNPAGVVGNTINFTMNGNGHHAAPQSQPSAATASQATTSPPPTGQQSSFLLNAGLHDEGNAQCTNNYYSGQFLHTESHGWLLYTGTHWSKEGATAAVERAITATLEARINAAILAGSQGYADLIKKCVPDRWRITGVRGQLQSLVYADIGSFDNSPDLLNCPNGVVDLRTGQLTPHSTAQRFMYCTAVDYEANADYVEWVEWLSSVTSPEIADWLQLAAGYSITGHTREEILFYLYGPPRSGKGTFSDALKLMLGGSVANTAQFSTFTAERGKDDQNFDLAPLKPARLIIASETNTYERFNEAKVKQITGGDSVRCAFKGKDQFEYKPQFKIWLSSNHPVNADPDDDAVWGRIRVIEFPHSHLGKEDKTLKEKMHSPEMLKAILAWAVAGAVRWYQLGSNGLSELTTSVDAKQAQRTQLDYVQQWIDECCDLSDPGAIASNSDIRTSYETWCKNNGVKEKQAKGLTQALLRKGFSNNNGNVINYYDPFGKRLTKRGFFGIKVKY